MPCLFYSIFLLPSAGGSASNMESGSNEKGSWLKFPDGTMIQYGYLPGELSSTKYYFPIDLPQKFVDNNYIVFRQSVGLHTDNNAPLSLYQVLRSKANGEMYNTKEKFYLSLVYSNPTVCYTGNTPIYEGDYWLVIGRWK